MAGPLCSVFIGLAYLPRLLLHRATIQGVKVKLPVRKGREGKVLGRVTKADDKDTDTDNSDHERGDGEGGGLVLKAADPAESHGFRALFSTEEDGALGAAPPFAGQVCVLHC